MKKLAAPAVAIAMVGASGLALIKTHEGKVNRVYPDPVGILTACYGHTGPELRLGMTFSDAQCDAMLMADIAEHQVVLLPSSGRNCIARAPLNQNQLDALTSFTFNTGTTKFCASTMAKRLRVQDYRGAAVEFPKWTKATLNGKRIELPGLVKRRTAERRLFEAPSTPARANAATGQLRAILNPFK